MYEPTPPQRFTLRDLSLPARLVLSAFLISVGVGYVSAMVQLHFQQSSRNGGPLPTKDNVIDTFHGKKDLTSQLVKLITGPETGSLEQGTTMAPAFFKNDGGEFKKAARKRPEAEVWAEREGERAAILAWVENGVRKEYYMEDAFPLPADLRDKPLTAKFNNDGKAKIRSIFVERCVRCHHPTEGEGKAASFPLDNYDAIAKYAKVSRGFMSIEKLTQSTHAHLLSFAVLYCLTGLIFAFTSYPGWFRGLVAPLVLVAQVIDIACWWLARIEGPLGEHFAVAILYTGGVVGFGLAIQIVLGLFNMYSLKGKLVLLLLAAAGAFGGYVAYEKVVVPHLAEEVEAARAAQEESRKAPQEGDKGKDEKGKGAKEKDADDK